MMISVLHLGKSISMVKRRFLRICLPPVGQATNWGARREVKGAYPEILIQLPAIHRCGEQLHDGTICERTFI